MVGLQSALDNLLVASLGELGLHCNFPEEEIHDRGFIEGALPVAFVHVHVRNNGRVVNELDVACFKTALHDLVANHLHPHLRLLPQPVHNFKELQGKVVLSQIVTTLEQELQLLLLLLSCLLLIAI